MLVIKDLKKRYGKFEALKGMNMTIQKGELFGFVGPNGAGKTTTMKIVSGLLSADSGEVILDGKSALGDVKYLKQKIGYMPDFFGVYDNLKAMEYMEFYASIYGIDGKGAKQLCMDLMDLVNLSDKYDSYVDGLSRGMKQRLCLARCLVHNPELLILDEPASGLDPRARFEMKEILKNLTDMGKTILISSHILPELAEMCSSIGIVEHGEMIVNGTVDEILTKLNNTNPLMIKVIDGKEEALRILKENPDIQNIVTKEDSISVGFNGNEAQEAELLKMLIENGIKVSSYKREEGNLEELFMQITEKDGEEKK